MHRQVAGATQPIWGRSAHSIIFFSYFSVLTPVTPGPFEKNAIQHTIFFTAMPLPNPAPQNGDRRQTPRVRCGGLARIVSLPSEGMAVPGKVLDLSLGGCGIETPFPVPSGTRAEILLRVNAASIRVIGEVQDPRGSRRVGIQFLLLSGYGKNLLQDLIRELARQQAIAAIAHAARRQPDIEIVRPRPALLAAGYSNGGSLVTLVEAGTKPLVVEPTVIEHPTIQHPTIDVVEAALTNDSRILRVEELDLFI
jgi:hypothetical protein